MPLGSLCFLARVSSPSHPAIQTGSQKRALSVAIALLAAATWAVGAACAQTAGRRAGNSDFRALADHVPIWADADHFVAAVPDDEQMDGLTIILERHPDRQQAFEKLLDDQQNPASPLYQHWLTSTEIGERFGLPDDEIDALKSWLESEGLHVDWVAPAKNFIGFGGAAGDVARAFRTEVNDYEVNGERRRSIATPPMLPSALAPRVKAISGLYTVHTQPDTRLVPQEVRSIASPDYTYGGSYYLIAPSDFKTIYDFPSAPTGKGVTIGIIGRARVNPADLASFQKLTSTTFATPTEVVPTAYGGIDPGPPYTTLQSEETELLSDQVEATGDVDWSGSLAPGANLLLMVSALYSRGDTDGTHPDAQYLVQTNPVPAQVIVMDFHICEYEGGYSEVSFWNSIFSQGAAEGVSAFSGSGDGGAAGCDTKFQTPPESPYPISIDAICSTSYETCVGGTEFVDSADPSKYWNSSNGAGLLSAKGYIPEGAWNDPYNEDTPPTTEIAASGGGVSGYIATPSYQVGTGVPTARTGRYVPDLAFPASINNFEVFCLAATGATCTGGSISGLTGSGGQTMAAIAALLDQQQGKAQGVLNYHLYSMAASSPSAFHDITVATSGVSNCTLSTPSLCNNTVPSPTGLTGGQKGYEVGVGYDEVTGLGSLDVGKFFDAYVAFKAPAPTTGAAGLITSTTARLAGTLNPNGQSTQYWFLYSATSSFKSPIQSEPQTAAAGSSTIPVYTKIASLAPATKYYYKIQAQSYGGETTGSVESFTTAKASQTIAFTQPANPVVYGTAPIALAATASSGLAVKFTVLSGDAVVSGSTLKIHGAGAIVIAASQAGNSTYLAAAEVKRTVTVNKAKLTVTANSLSMTQGGSLPMLTYAMTGWVNGDTQAKATSGQPALSTTATSSSPAGTYPITVKIGTLTATNYSFKLVNGTLTVNAASGAARANAP
jgi:subtilase family serine protease